MAKVAKTYRLDSAVVEELERVAAMRGVSKTQVVEEALRSALAGVGEAPADAGPVVEEPQGADPPVPLEHPLAAAERHVDEELAVAFATLAGKPISLARMFAGEGRLSRSDKGLILLDGKPAVSLRNT